MALDVRIKTGVPDRGPTRETDFFGWLAEQAAHARAGRTVEQRQQLRRLISRNPSLRGELEKALADHDCYIDGRDRALAEVFAAGIRIDLPEVTPWSPAQVPDLDFWPGEGPHPELTDRQRGRRKPASR